MLQGGGVRRAPVETKRDPYEAMVDHHLSLCYRGEVLQDGAALSAIPRFRDALRADQALRKAAEARLAGIDPQVTQRDYVSRRHREFLTAALAKESK